MNLWKYIWNLLSNLFNWDPKAAEQRKELKKIHARLQSLSPQYYRPQTQQVLPGFARVVYEFAHTLLFVRSLFEKTILQSDQKLARRYHDYLIECHLPEDERLKRQYFEHKALYGRLVSAVSAEEEIKKINHEFREYIKLFGKPGFARIDLSLNELYRFVTLCQHNFENLLAYFSPDIDISRKKGKPSFKPVQASNIIPELLDFYFISADLPLSGDIEKNIFLLLDRLKLKDGDKVRDRMKTVLTRIESIQKRYLTQSILLSLLQAIKSDPDFTAETSDENIPYMKRYLDTLNGRFTKNLDTALKELNENALVKDIKELLNGQPLVPILGYNDDECDMLHRNGLPAFTNVKPLTILKNFILRHFGQTQKSAITKLLFEGYFEDRQFRINLSDIFNGCNESLNRIADFEKSMIDDASSPLAKIHSAVEGGNPEGSDPEDLGMFIDAIDKRAAMILEKEINLFNSLATRLFEIIGDAKQKHPSIVNNIRVIGGDSNSELLSGLIENHDRIRKLISIIQNFTIIHENVKKLAEREP
ncbi:MAG: hypothetical protein JW881_15440 [Spirochaetales bacterium]|nr:hypothetical protein [Spirochaetales bacterium]